VALIGKVPVVRYRGFVLLIQEDMSWLVRPERSPMHVLPFRAPTCSVADVKALVDWRLGKLGRDRQLMAQQPISTKTNLRLLPDQRKCA
jgi:hypothetical protein